MTIVGTPSSIAAATPFAGVGRADGITEEEEESGAGSSALATAEPARKSSSELRLNSCHHRAQTPCAPTHTLMHPVTYRRLGRLEQPRPVSAGAEMNLRKARALDER